MVAADRSVLRKVYFSRTSLAETTLEGLSKAIRHIATLDFNDQGRYLPTTSDDNVLALFVSTSDFPFKLQFARIRRADLPLIEDKGKISPLKIATSAGVLDWAHIVLFEDGIVAAESNRDAPKLAKLGEYLYFKARGILDTAPKFLPLFEKAVLAELAKFSDLTFLEVEAPTNEADTIAEADPNLGAAFRACRNAGSAKNAKLILKAPIKGRSLDLMALAKRLFSNQRSREALTNLKISGKTEKGRRPLDMLEDYLVASESFMRLDSRTRALSSDDAFRVIEQAYKDNKHRFANAATAVDL